MASNRQRPFRPGVLKKHAVPALKPRIGPGEFVWRFVLTVPLEEIRPKKMQKATASDLDNLETAFIRHFGGFTRMPNSAGFGLRYRAKRAQKAEMNYNAYFAVLSAPIPEADAYFRALRHELELALNEGVI